MSRVRFARFLALGLVMIPLVGCSIDGRLRRARNQSITIDARADLYRLKPGDPVALFFTVRSPCDTCEYLVEPGDQVRIIVADREDLSSVYTVAPDGYLYFPSIAPIRARDLGPRGLDATIKNALKTVSAEATVSANIIQFQSKSRALVSAVTQTFGQGPIFRTIVSSEGALAMPQLGNVYCAGKSLAQIADTLKFLYSKDFPSLDVVPLTETSTVNAITVLGEVNRPGAFPATVAVTLSNALGLAGGWQKTAHLETTILIQREGATIRLRRVNFKRELLLASQMRLSAGDIVFVPAKPVTDLNRFIDDYIRQNIPGSVYFPLRAGAGVTLW